MEVLSSGYDPVVETSAKSNMITICNDFMRHKVLGVEIRCKRPNKGTNTLFAAKLPIHWQHFFEFVA